MLGSATSSNTLTASYGDNTADLDVGGSAEIVLYITYTPAENDRVLTWKLQGSNDASDYYQLPILTEKSDGTRESKLLEDYFGESVVASTAYKFLIPYSVNSQGFRISFKEDGSSDFGTLTVRFKVGGI